MMKETKAQTKVGVGIEVLWRALTKDLGLILPKVVPNLVRDVQLLEGDGGLGTLMLINFGSDVTNITYQKEKIVELDEMEHRIGLKVIEGGHLNNGYASYTTIFQLSNEIGVTDQETQVDIIVIYDTETEETDMPLQTAKSALAFIHCLENYLLKNYV
ncbi:Bet v I domain [Macleaya cordata]|uniref:Bet v I domain n=1 Tax=Macleaya cordata TaxID=56857 RepID=A0A200RBY4_MACCD|nr:Bet v I domain [Macleaya cordata]